MTTDNALSMLLHDQVCEVRTKDGVREAVWRPASKLFFFMGDELPTAEYCALDEVLEWWPAGVKF